MTVARRVVGVLSVPAIALGLATQASTPVSVTATPTVHHPYVDPTAVALPPGPKLEVAGDVGELGGVDRRLAQMRPSSSRDAIGARAAAENIANDVANANGIWTPVGATPLQFKDNPGYSDISASVTDSGRVQSLAYDPATPGRIFTAIGNSGIWESRDNGTTWRSIGDTLPTPLAGAVAFTPARGGTVIDGTGDSGYGFLGLGVYWSSDDGRNWHLAAGVPDDAITFKLAVDPTNADIVYAATSKGLFRSTDAAASFVNVKLPTGKTSAKGPDCAGNTTAYQCVYNNWVTDVAVRAAGSGGKGGQVLAAVGWFRGFHPTVKGWNNAVGNGLYRSNDGSPGTFVNLHVDQHGFTTPQSHIGNIALSAATGPQQDKDVVWAIVSDGAAANNTFPLVDPGTALDNACALGCYNTLLDNIYTSTDFGATWQKKLVDAHQLQVCAVTGTDLCGIISFPVVSAYGPGIQAWYNLHINIDPTAQNASGIPTRVVFGLEEPWQIEHADQPGPSAPKVIGRYFGDPFCPEAVLPFVTTPNPPVCPGQPPAPTSTHPDQHAGLFIPDGKGGVTLFSGNDGGVYSQHVGPGESFDNTKWGKGANAGLHTLLSYQAVMAADGTVYSGLQDNGELKILPDGRQVAVFGGDGGFSGVDPNNSNLVYEEYVGGAISASTDGGKTWVDMNPGNSNAQFTTQFSVDPLDAKHVLTGGTDITETVSGAATGTPLVAGQKLKSSGWKTVYDLGSGPNGVYAMSASALRGDSAYVGFCGACYIPSTVSLAFKNGIATNVGGSAPGKKMSGAGWHKAKAIGLPQRQIKWITIDDQNPKIVYVALGDYDAAYRPPGALGDDVSKVGHGRVFKSVDAGEHFTDISANLPDAAANTVIERSGQLIVGTNVGAFISRNLDGTKWALLGGSSLPVAIVTSLQMKPGDNTTMLAATYGRGVYTYHFPSSGPVVVAGRTATKPAAGRGSHLPATGGSPLALELGSALVGLALALAGLMRWRPRASRTGSR